jgi:molybdenum cofactor cytidylyltransferase
VKFGEVAVTAAEGRILAHGLRLADGTLKKGRVLDRADVARLRAAGVERVVAATLEAGDVPEDAAAERLAGALAGAGVRVAAPFTGRCNLFSEARGLLTVDAARIDAVNRVHESLTVATLDAPVAVDRRQMLATVKVIPFAVTEGVLEAALAAAAPAAIVHPFLPLRAALIQTRLPGTREAVLDKTARVLSARLEALGSALGREWRCSHEAAAVATAVGEAISGGHDLVLVAGASAIVDRRDVVPAGIVAAGGGLVHFGMPVDPGNLLLVARHGDAAVLGLPGCARSPKFNGLDQVLERLAAALPVTPEVVMGMGVGGLLKEIADRPQPRGGSRGVARAPRVAALVLAAGRSRRMGAINKLLADVDGVPMVRATVAEVAAAGLERVVVVTGHEASRVREALGGLDAAGAPLEFVHNRDYAHGLSTSLARGIEAVGEDIDALLVCLGDMPRVRARDLARLLAAFDPVEGRCICVPTFRGKRGNPVLWDRSYFQEMCAVRGDVGARHLIGEHDEAVCEVAMDHDGVLLDVDSPQALAALTGGTAPSA